MLKILSDKVKQPLIFVNLLIIDDILFNIQIIICIITIGLPWEKQNFNKDKEFNWNFPTLWPRRLTIFMLWIIMMASQVYGFIMTDNYNKLELKIVI